MTDWGEGGITYICTDTEVRGLNGSGPSTATILHYNIGSTENNPSINSKPDYAGRVLDPATRNPLTKQVEGRLFDALLAKSTDPYNTRAARSYRVQFMIDPLAASFFADGRTRFRGIACGWAVRSKPGDNEDEVSNMLPVFRGDWVEHAQPNKSIIRRRMYYIFNPEDVKLKREKVFILPLEQVTAVLETKKSNDQAMWSGLRAKLAELDKSAKEKAQREQSSLLSSRVAAKEKGDGEGGGKAVKVQD